MANNNMSQETEKALAKAYLNGKVNSLANTKHPKSAKGLVKSAIKKAFDQRVMQVANPLFNAQARLAMGLSYLFRVDKYEARTGKGQDVNIEYRKKPAVIVTDSNEIKEYIDNISQGKTYHEDDECEYYYIHTVKPDNQAIDSMLNRTFGRAKETIEIDENITISLKDLAKERLKLTREADIIDVHARPLEDDLENVTGIDLERLKNDAKDAHTVDIEPINNPTYNFTSYE